MEPSTLIRTADIIMGQSPPGEACNNNGRGLPLLNGPTEYGPRHPTPVQFTTDPRKKAQPGDILFCVRGSTTGRMNWADREYAIGRGVAAIRHKTKPELQPLVRAVIEYGLPGLLAQATGSTFPNVSAAQLANVWWPPLEEREQAAIAELFGALDDKIESNRRTSRTLEKLARAIFRAWFVDFEPVKAKAAGARSFPSMPQQAFDALPTRLVPSELGPIPEGWEVGTMGDIGRQRREKVSPEDTAEGTAYIGLEHMPRRCIALSEWGVANAVTSAKSRFSTGDILFGKLRPYFHKVGPAPMDGICSTDIVVFSSKKPEAVAWLLMAVSSDEFVSHANQTSAGTKMPRTNWKDMANFPMALPSAPLFVAFQEVATPMLDLIRQGIYESRKLAAMRDYLLPKLLSGEVRVGDADGFMGAGGL